MFSRCELIASSAWFLVVFAFILAALIVRRYWTPLPDEELQQSRAVWRRILNHVIGGGTLAIALLVILYGGCGWFGARCWTGGFCEAAWRGPPWILVSGVAAAPAAVLLWHWRTVQKAKDQEHKERELCQQQNGSLAQLFSEAAKLLNESSPLSRLGALFALQSIVNQDLSAYASPAIETLCAFISHVSPKQTRTLPYYQDPAPKVEGPVAVAIQQALQLVVRANLPVNFRLSNLAGSSLQSARAPDGSQFVDCCFEGANCREAIFRKSNFTRAELLEADLESADLSGSCFLFAKFDDSRLCGVNFCGADLRHASGLESAWLDNATYDKRTRFPPKFEPDAWGMKEAADLGSSQHSRPALKHGNPRRAGNPGELP